jgi:hypothetical protein
MAYLLTLASSDKPLNRLVANAESGHTVVVVFETHRWQDAIYSVVAMAAERFITWLEASELITALRMFFAHKGKPCHKSN